MALSPTRRRPSQQTPLLMLAHRAGTEFIIENPADRGDLTEPSLFIDAAHGPLWLMAAVCALSRHASTKVVTFAMCEFGAPWQKYTTLMYTAGLSSWLDVLRERRCTHTSHEKIAGGTKDKSGGWNSNEAAAYPPDFNSYLAQAAADLVKQRRLNLAPTSSRAEEAHSDTEAAAESGPRPDVPKGSSFPPRPKAPAPADTLVHLKAPTSVETLGDNNDTTIGSAVDAANDSSPSRRLSFADEYIAHEEPDEEELTNDVEPPAIKPARKRVTFEKTAGARATRSQKPTLSRALFGLGVSAGYMMVDLGMSVASSAYALGTTDFFDEITSKQNTLGAAMLAKPSATDPKSQSEAYSHDKAGWQKSEAKELKNHADNGSWEYIDASQLPRGRRLVMQARMGLQSEPRRIAQVAPLFPRLSPSPRCRLRPDVVRRHAGDFASRALQPSRQLRHAHEAVRLRRRVLTG